MSTNIYDDFKKELELNKTCKTRILASRLLYDMMLDHNNAMLFGFNYRFHRDENKNLTKTEDAFLTDIKEKQSREEDWKEFISGENIKTLFLLNFAYFGYEERKKELARVRHATSYWHGSLMGSHEHGIGVRKNTLFAAAVYDFDCHNDHKYNPF